MRLFFWDFDDYNDIGREWALFAINILAVIFTTYSLVSTARLHKRCIFELIPLSINALATVTLLLLKLFEKGYQFDEIGYIIEIFTYFLFCYTFGQMHHKVVRQSVQVPLKKYTEIYSRICDILLFIAAVFTITMIGLVIAKEIAKSCDNNIFVIGIASFITELISFVPTAYFGFDILKKITKKHAVQKLKQSLDNTQQLFHLISDEYVRERKKQIGLVLISYLISVLLRGITLLCSYLLQDYFTCGSYDDVFIVTSDSAAGQFLLVLIQINQLIPHVIIPVALYIVPAKQTRNKDIKLQESLIDEEQQEQDQSEAIQRRISHGLLRKSISNQEISSPTRREISTATSEE